jgi:HAMP domain-containing protein
VAAADKISLGQLDTPVSAERNDEIGDLARALERMRLSLEAAMERLRKRRNRA